MKPARLFAAVAPFALIATMSAAEPINTGASLPKTAASDQDGKAVDLAADASKGYTLVYFYPKADTPGCTKQACSLRDSYEALTQKGVKVYGASMDDQAAQKAFKDKYHLPFTLIADKDAKVADAFGVPHEKGFATRQAFLFKDGKLVWRDLAAATEKQAEDVLKVLDGAKS